MPQGRIVPPRNPLENIEQIAANMVATLQQLNVVLDKSLEILGELEQLNGNKTKLSKLKSFSNIPISKLKKVQPLAKDKSLYVMNIKITSNDPDYGDYFTCFSTHPLYEGEIYNFSIYRWKEIESNWVVWLGDLQPI